MIAANSVEERDRLLALLSEAQVIIEDLEVDFSGSTLVSSMLIDIRRMNERIGVASEQAGE